MATSFFINVYNLVECVLKRLTNNYQSDIIGMIEYYAYICAFCSFLGETKSFLRLCRYVFLKYYI